MQEWKKNILTLEHIDGNFFLFEPKSTDLFYALYTSASHTKNIHVWHIFCMTIAFPIPPIDNIQSLYHCLIYKYIQYYSNSCKHINAFLIKVFVIMSRNLGKSVIYFCGFFRKRTIKKENQSFWSNKKNLTGDLSNKPISVKLLFTIVWIYPKLEL